MPAAYEGYGAWFLERVRETLLADDAVMTYLNDEPRRVYHQQSDNPPTGLSDEAPIVGLQIVSGNTAKPGRTARATFTVQVTVAASTPWYKSHPEEDLQNLTDAITHRLTRGAGPKVIPLGATGGSETGIGGEGEPGLAGHVTVGRRFRFRVLGIE